MEVHAGHGHVIRGILEQARKAYGHHVAKPRAKKATAAVADALREAPANAG